MLERIFGENDKTAAANRADVRGHGVRAVNLMSSPGAGKTTLLRETLARLAGLVRIGIIEGDIETSLDADRLAGFGAAVALINTGNGFGGECHLDAPMVALGAAPAAARTSSTWCSSRTSATWSARPSSTSARTPGRWSTRSPRARRSRSSTR